MKKIPRNILRVSLEGIPADQKVLYFPEKEAHFNQPGSKSPRPVGTTWNFGNANSQKLPLNAGPIFDALEVLKSRQQLVEDIAQYIDWEVRHKRHGKEDSVPRPIPVTPPERSRMMSVLDEISPFSGNIINCFPQHEHAVVSLYYQPLFEYMRWEVVLNHDVVLKLSQENLIRFVDFNPGNGSWWEAWVQNSESNFLIDQRPDIPIKRYLLDIDGLSDNDFVFGPEKDASGDELKLTAGVLRQAVEKLGSFSGLADRIGEFLEAYVYQILEAKPAKLKMYHFHKELMASFNQDDDKASFAFFATPASEYLLWKTAHETEAVKRLVQNGLIVFESMEI